MSAVGELLAAGLAEHRAGGLDAARTLYRRALDADPDQPDALHLLGLTYRQSGQNDEARALIERALRINPSMIDARLNLANLLRGRGLAGEARRLWRTALALDPVQGQAWRGLGDIESNRGSAGYGQAIALLRRAAQCDPGSAETQHDLGLVLRQDEQIDAAIAHQRRAIELGLAGPAGYMSLGNSLMALGDEAGSIAALGRALAIAPDSRESWFNLGNALFADGDSVAALRAYTRADMLGLAMARSRRAAMLVDLGRLEEAEAALLAMLPLPGTDVPVCIELLYDVLTRRGRSEQARQMFERLSEQPLAGRVYGAESRTALSALDLAQGMPERAAERLSDIRSDNCWLFTTRSLAALARTRGGRIERPVNPDPARPRIGSTTLGTRGRFAHNVLEYVLLRLYAEKQGMVLETPDWVGGAYFDLDDPQPSGPLPPWLFARHQLNDLVTGRGSAAPRVNRDVLSPLFLFDYKLAYRDRVQSWLAPRAEWLPMIEPAVNALRASGATVVALHIRRGDFVHYGYPITETAWYVEWLRQLWPTLDRPVLYLASDDLAAVRDAFAEFSPLSLGDVAAVWRDLDFLQDFHVLTQADVVGISAASGFSQLAARLNRRASILVEPDPAARAIVPFIPWTTG